MATQVIRTVIQLRRATTAEWEQYKTIAPACGEPCFDYELNTLRIGDGKKTYEELTPIGGIGTVSMSADGNSIVLENGVFKLAGFDAAATNAQPRKNADGQLEWVIPAEVNTEALEADVAELKDDVAELQQKMDGIGEGTVDAKITAKIDEFAAKVTDNGAIDTIKELINYVAEHGSEVEEILSDIATLQGLVGDTPVATQISSAIAKSGHITDEDAKAIFKHVKYEISHKPVGTLVDYRDDEIRVMVPADTEFELQNSGANADPNAYYIGFKAYAPEDAVSFKEDLAETISDDTMYTFEGNDFAGTDAYGRKYSICWLAVATYDEATQTWSRYGEMSDLTKYIGWFYSVEWYDANGIKIASDCIRINLSNESCHDTAEPYYMGGVISGIGAGLKESDEVVIAEDGTLGIGSVSFDKISINDDTTVILDGGGASEQ